MSNNLNKLKAILREMFQLDQADLDFGIYRIINQKRGEIDQFLDRDLLPQVKTAFAGFQGDDQSSIRDEMDKLKKTLEDAGVVAETTPKFQALQAKLSQSVDVSVLENEVFSQLTNFFRRYYQGGDFLSLRRYKAGVYAIPYEGEEVKLHWANADQYYIKSSENFRDYTFKLPSGKRAHFKLVDATTEQNNKKEQAGKERRFILVEDTPLVVDNGELFIRFEYRLADESSKQAALNDAAVQAVLATADGNWKRELSALAPTEKNPRRTVLEKHLNDYTAKYSFDYFIHKDLGGFMRRELDFFIKNEVLFIDDLDADHIKATISKVKVIKTIGHKVIAFLEQLENFQKKLWLKKKFVVETGYCMTLDKVPEALYPNIIANTTQVEEWKRLFAIQDIEGDLHTPKYSDPLTVEFLKANPFLQIDTAFFDREFTEKLLAAFDNLDSEINSLLIHGENYQALNLIGLAIRNCVSNIFIDPPYNTGDDGFLYKDNYPSSTWLSMIEERIDMGVEALSDKGVFFASIGDEEQEYLASLLRQKYGKERFFATLIWEKKKKGSFLSGQIARMKDYIVCVSKDQNKFNGLIGEIASDTETYPCVNASNPRDVRKIQPGISSKYRERDYMLKAGNIISAGNMNLILKSDLVIKDGQLAEELVIEGNWRYSQESMDEYGRKQELYITQDLYLRRIVSEPRYKRMKDLLPRLGNEGESDFRAYDINDLSKYGWGTNEDANDELHQILGEQYASSYPKPSKLLTLLLSASRHNSGHWMDYFAGSGTTGHAVINLNREDKGNRKFILVEMGDYFDTVLKPRIQKVIYSKDWKDGKPVSREGSSHLFKYIRLESYEDALNNLQLKRSPEQGSLLDQHDKLREQYMLSYMLDVESAGSASLLNISAFADPFNYRLNIARGNETKETVVDLVETFNWLLSIKVLRISQKEYRTADFEVDAEGRLQIKGRPRTCDKGEGWTFQEVEGQTLSGDKVLVIWRTLTDNPEQDNLMLDTWFGKRNYSTLDFEFARIYVNGDNNLENLKIGEERWKVALTEQEFKKLMFDVEGV